MTKIFIALLTLISSSAYAQGGAEEVLSFVNIMDTQVVEFHSAIDVVIVATMAFVSFVQLFFG